MHNSTLTSELNATTWPVPSVFKWLKKAGNMDNDAFARYATAPNQTRAFTDCNVDSLECSISALEWC